MDYISSLREKLHRACDLPHDSLLTTQSKMKTYDEKFVVWIFQSGDQVLDLVSIIGSSLQARFYG